jgi:hypothetical protein
MCQSRTSSPHARGSIFFSFFLSLVCVWRSSAHVSQQQVCMPALRTVVHMCAGNAAVAVQPSRSAVLCSRVVFFSEQQVMSLLKLLRILKENNNTHTYVCDSAIPGASPTARHQLRLLAASAREHTHTHTCSSMRLCAYHQPSVTYQNKQKKKRVQLTRYLFTFPQS